ncbi:purin 7 isoform X2 [Wolffia australiana]
MAASTVKSSIARQPTIVLFKASPLRFGGRIPMSQNRTLDARQSVIAPKAVSPRSSSSRQALQEDAAYREEVLRLAQSSLSNCLTETQLDFSVPGLSSKSRGKVRDVYEAGEYLVLVTTDRQSAFDRILASIPFKGQVLNQTSQWWFNKTQDITPNAVVCTPDPNVTIARKCTVFPVEFVVRGFVTGSTDTSLWTVYNKGIRNYCGNILSEGMVKNQKLPTNILTPTTKAIDHDVPVTPKEIIELGLMTQEEFEEASSKALRLFAFGQVHTPDSSRYWIADSYEERFANGLEPENVDKEFLRLWFRDHCNPYEDKVLPDAPEELICELSWRYIFLYETITNSRFLIASSEETIHDRITRNVARALSSL